LLLLIPNRTVSLAASFAFNFIYLLTAYVWYSTEEYDLNWTTPQCVLTLRLIGFSFDYFDGGRETKELGPEEKLYRLEKLPNLINVFGFSYFFTAVLAGPQFTYYRYQQLLSENIYRVNGKDKSSTPSCVLPVLRCFLIGVLFLALYNVFSIFLPTTFLKSDAFYEQSLWERIIYGWLILQFVLYRYLGVWMIAEGSSILTGIGFNGYTKEGEPRWDGVTNVNPWGYVFATNHQQVIDNFNINTNDWVKRYIFKRMKFANNRHISAGTALFFLALWHGFSIGYFYCFAMEFTYMEAEKRYQALTKNFVSSLPNAGPVGQAAYHAYCGICWFVRQILMHYAFVPFELKLLSLTHRYYGSVYYFGHILVLSVFFIYPILFPIVKGSQKKVE
jgi:lysophospholipid acyltransferase 5